MASQDTSSLLTFRKSDRSITHWKVESNEERMKRVENMAGVKAVIQLTRGPTRVEKLSSIPGLPPQVNLCPVDGGLNTSTADTYQYQPLDSSRPSIRLLSFLPSQGDGAVRLKIEHQSLDEAAGNFDAVSYTWGSGTAAHKVWIDGSYLLLRDNIYSFLQHYQEFRRSPSTRLWVDSICINQTDVPEKNSQVPLMGQIFGRAAKVLVWLGQCSRSSIFGARAIDWARSKGSDHIDWDTFIKDNVPQDSKPYIQTELNEDVFRILENEYWSRQWIVQETALAQGADIILGPCLMDFQAVSDLAQKGSRWAVDPESSSHDEQATDFADLPGQIATIYQVKFPQKKIGLESLLGDFCKQRCADIRDRVYALLGLLENGSEFRVDYEEPKERMFFRALSFICSEYKVNDTPAVHVAEVLLTSLQLETNVLLRYIWDLPPVAAEPFHKFDLPMHFPLVAIYFDLGEGPPTILRKTLFRMFGCSDYSTSHFYERYIVRDGEKNADRKTLCKIPNAVLAFSISTKTVLLLSKDAQNHVHILGIGYTQIRHQTLGLKDIAHHDEHYDGIVHVRSIPEDFSSRLSTALNDKNINFQAFWESNVKGLLTYLSAYQVMQLTAFSFIQPEFEMPQTLRAQVEAELTPVRDEKWKAEYAAQMNQAQSSTLGSRGSGEGLVTSAAAGRFRSIVPDEDSNDGQNAEIPGDFIYESDNADEDQSDSQGAELPHDFTYESDSADGVI